MPFYTSCSSSSPASCRQLPLPSAFTHTFPPGVDTCLLFPLFIHIKPGPGESSLMKLVSWPFYLEVKSFSFEFLQNNFMYSSIHIATRCLLTSFLLLSWAYIYILHSYFHVYVLILKLDCRSWCQSPWLIFILQFSQNSVFCKYPITTESFLFFSFFLYLLTYLFLHLLDMLNFLNRNAIERGFCFKLSELFCLRQKYIKIIFF